MSMRWIKRCVWVGLLMVLGVLPAALSGAGARALAGVEGTWALRGVIVGIAVMGVGLAVVGKRGRGWR